MTEQEREKADAWALKMAELDPGLCVSAGGEPYREFIGPRPGAQQQPATEQPKVDDGIAPPERPLHGTA